MTRPTPTTATAAKRLVGNLERDLKHQLRRTKDGDKLDLLLARARHAITVGMIPSGNDGYPTTTPGNGNPTGGGGRHIIVPDENGQPDRVPITSTEAAAIDRTTNPDPVAAIARTLLAELVNLKTSLDEIEGALSRFDALRSMAATNDPPQCHVASKMHKLPWDVMWEPWRTSDLGGTFPEPVKLSKYVYWFHRDNGRLPSKNEMLKYLEKGVVMVGAR